MSEYLGGAQAALEELRAQIQALEEDLGWYKKRVKFLESKLRVKAAEENLRAERKTQEISVPVR